MVSGGFVLGTLLTSSLSAALSAISPKPGRSFVQPGGQGAWDDCCDGQLWIRIISIQPASTSIPGCPPEWDVLLGLGIIRCVSTVDDRGIAPPAASLTSEAAQMVSDLEALESVVAEHKNQRWIPLGPQGGCAGGEWSFEARGVCM